MLGHIPGISKADLVGDTHGGFVETSQLLALHPEWLDTDYQSLPRRTVALWHEENGREKPPGLGGRAASIPEMVRGFKAGIHYFVKDRYAGSPAGASAVIGEQILDTLASRTTEAIAEVLDGTLPPAQRHSPFWRLRHIFVNRLAIRLFDWWKRVPRTVG